MAQEQTRAEAPVVVKTQKQLIAEMQKATAANDWKGVSKVAAEIARMVAAEERAALEVKQKAVVELTTKVKAIIDKALKPMYDSKELDMADGIWYVWDFGEKLSSCRLTKGIIRAKGTGGGGGGKKFGVKTEDLLAEHGSKVMDKETGQTFQQAYDANSDGNKRYLIRVKLLKAVGIS